jgi:hypothetical protein
LPQVASGKQSVQVPAMIEAPVLECRRSDCHCFVSAGTRKSPGDCRGSWFANLEAQ